jgi:hypothetical protein
MYMGGNGVRPTEMHVAAPLVLSEKKHSKVWPRLDVSYNIKNVFINLNYYLLTNNK